MPGPVSRTVSIYIDQTAAEQSAQRLEKTITRLTNTIKKGEAAGKDMSSQIADLEKAKTALNDTNAIIAGKMTPAMKMLTQQASRLRNELSNMSRDNAGYKEKLKLYQDINKELDKMDKELKGVREEFDKEPKSGGFWSKLKDGFLQGIGIGSGIALVQQGISWLKEFISDAAEAASQMEQLRVSFTTLLGSQKASSEFIRELQKYAQKTPFEFNELAEYSKQMLAFGFASKDILPTLDMLGNIASGVGKEKLPNLILAFSQARSAGKLMAQDLNQMINAGFNPLQVISQKTGKSIGDLRSDMENGLITFDKVQDAFKSATSEGGTFFNLMNNQSATTSGTLSNLKDNWDQLKATLGEGANNALKGVYLGLGSIVNKIREWVSLSPGEEIAQERDEFNALIQTLIVVNKHGGDRSAIIAEINSKYPELIKNIDLETIGNDALLSMLKAVNTEYKNKIMLAGFSAAAEKKADDNRELSTKRAQAQTKVMEALSAAGFSEDKLSNVNFNATSNKDSSIREIADFLWKNSEKSLGIAKGIPELAELLTLNDALEKGIKEGIKLNEINSNAIDRDNERRQRAITFRKSLIDDETEEINRLQALVDKGKASAEDLKKLADVTKDLASNRAALTGMENVYSGPIERPGANIAPSHTMTATEKKAKRDHDKAVKDVDDLQFQLQKLQDDIKAAQVDADAGFEDKYNKQVQAIVDKYNALIKKVKERLSDLAGLTNAQKDQLNQMIKALEDAENAEKSILAKSHEKEKNERNYKADLKKSGNFYQQQRQQAGLAYKDGLISFQEYQDKLTSLEAQEAFARAALAASYADNVKTAAEDLESAKTKALEKGIKDRRTLEERNRDEELAILQLRVLQAAKGSRAQWEAQRAVIIQNFEEQKKQKIGNAAEIALLDAQEKDQLKALDAQYWKDKLQNIANSLSSFGSLISSFMDYLSQGDQSQLDQEQARNNEKKKSYQRMLDNKQISQAQYDKYINDSDAEQEKKEIEIRKRMAKRQKAAALFNAIIQTAQAVLQALGSAPPPFSFILAALAGAAGALQIATIARQKEPQFKRGGIFDRKGGIAKGAKHESGGIALIDSATGQKVGEMEDGEAYMILSQKTTAANRPLIEKLLASSKSGRGERIAPDWVYAAPQQLDYGDAIETIHYTNQFRNGGITIPTTPERTTPAPGATSSDQKLFTNLAAAIEVLNKNLNNPVKAYVTWTDLEQMRKKYEMLQKEASLNPTG